MIEEYYKNLYRDREKSKYTFGPPEKELISFLNSKHLQGRIKVLDLGCGDGRNTIFLASKNFIVLGIDSSASGLKKLKNTIKSNDRIAKNIKLRKADLKTVRLKREEFDLVMCINTFHELSIHGVKHLIIQAKHSTKQFGINYLAFFLPQKGTYMRKEGYYPRELDIIEQYEDWKVLKKKKFLMTHFHKIPDSKGKIIKHKHFVCHLFLQKLAS